MLRISKTALAAGLSLGLSVAFLASSPGSADDAPAPPTAHTETELTREVNGALDAAESVDLFGRNKYPFTYGGVRLTEMGNHLVVYLTARNVELETAISTVAGLTGDSLSFEVRRISAQSRDDFHLQLTQDVPGLKKLGINVIYWAIDGETGRERMGVSGLTASARETLLGRYGSDWLDVVDVPNGGGSIPAADRHDDKTPWNGGDFVTDGGDYDCSSGFGVHNATGNQFLVTAAHCYAEGDMLYNGAAALAHGNFHEMGVVTNDSFSGGLDAALAFMSTSRVIWTGYTVGATRKTVTGKAGSPAGAVMCHSGAFEGEICGFVVDMAGCYSYQLPSPAVWCNVLHASSINQNPQAAGEGDSGGPVYLPGSGAKISGVLSGVEAPEFVQCVNWAPQSGPRLCGPNIWYTDIYAVLNKWGLTLNT